MSKFDYIPPAVKPFIDKFGEEHGPNLYDMTQGDFDKAIEIWTRAMRLGSLNLGLAALGMDAKMSKLTSGDKPTRIDPTEEQLAKLTNDLGSRNLARAAAAMAVG